MTIPIADATTIAANARALVRDPQSKERDLRGAIKGLLNVLDPLLAPIGDEETQRAIAFLSALDHTETCGFALYGPPALCTCYCAPMRIVGRAIRQQQAAMAWRTIDSAPKDGTRILICGGEYQDASETCPEWRSLGRSELVHWHDGMESGWRGEQTETYDEFYWYRPTHWLPLPNPPEKER
jgi:hypothetical protein